MAAHTTNLDSYSKLDSDLALQACMRLVFVEESLWPLRLSADVPVSVLKQEPELRLRLELKISILTAQRAEPTHLFRRLISAVRL